jgi:hypothetical protein
MVSLMQRRNSRPLRRSKSDLVLSSGEEFLIAPLDLDLERKVNDICSNNSSPLSRKAFSRDGSIDRPMHSRSGASLEVPSSNASVVSDESNDDLKSTEKTLPPWKKLTEYVAENKTEDPSQYTTVLLRNIPTRYVTSWLIEEIQATGNRCNFVHMPMAKKFDINLGYAFINFMTPAEALNFIDCFEGHQFAKQPRSTKRAAVEFSSLQGFEANVDFYSARRITKSKYAPWILRD